MWSFVVIGFLIIGVSDAGITVEQMEKSGEMMRKACQPKHKVSDELVNGIRDGKFPDDKNLKCYVNCALEMLQTMKRGKVQYDAAMRQINSLLPDDYKDSWRNAIDTCKDVAKGVKDPCEASYKFIQCNFQNNDKFLFP